MADDTGTFEQFEKNKFGGSITLPKEEVPVTTDIAPAEKREVAKQVRAPIMADDRGILMGTDFETQYRLARVYLASGMMPRALDTPEKILVALQICRELDLPAMTSIGKVAVINGVPSIFGDLPLALVKRSGKCTSIKEEWLKDEKGAIYGARCTVMREESEPVSREFTYDQARAAGLFTKNQSVWKVYPERMVQCRARSWALKDQFPDVLMGISIAEYDHNAFMDPKGNLQVEDNKPSIASEIDSYSDDEN